MDDLSSAPIGVYVRPTVTALRPAKKVRIAQKGRFWTSHFSAPNFRGADFGAF